jgi:hypothetical protein
MTLLTPSALFFAALLAVPVLVHIFKPRRVRKTPFSSLRWLAHSPQKLSRRIRWHQLLLFAMRAGFLLLLVFALARPLWTADGAQIVTDRVIVLDVSRSMALRVPARATPLERARDIAVEMIESAPPGTRTTVLLAGKTARRLGVPERDAAALLPDLRRVEPTEEGTNLAAALALAKPLFASSRGQSELVFLTDNHQGVWDADRIGAFAAQTPSGLHVRVIDVGSGGAANGWISSARVVETGNPPRRLLRIELASTGGDPQERTLHVRGISGETDAVRSVALEPGQLTVLHLELPEGQLHGQAAKLTLEPRDGLADDDEFYVTLDPRAGLRVLLIAPETPGPLSTGPGFALRTAINSLTDSGIRSSRVTLRAPATVSAADLNEADVVVLADVPELPESITAALHERVRTSAGLAVFLGKRIRSDWYNRNHFRALQPTEGLLPFEIGAVASPASRQPWLIPTRPTALLAGLGDPLVGDLAEVSSNRYYRLPAVLPSSASALAKVADDTPVLVEHRVGAGNVLVVNASPDDAFSDFPARKVFVPFVDRMLASLGRSRGRAFITGDAVALPLDGVRPGQTVTLTTPRDERRSIVVRGEVGHPTLELDNLERSGIYRVEGGNMVPLVFTMNADRADSTLSPTDAATLRSWWQPLECVVEPASQYSEKKPTHEAFPIWPVLLLTAVILLAAETLTAAWFCPKLAPPAAASLIQQQRLNIHHSS